MATEIILGEKYGLFDVDPDTGVKSDELTLHESLSLAQAAAQASVGRAQITWLNNATGDVIGVIKSKTCFQIEKGLHVQIKRRPRVLYVIPLPWSVFADQFRKDGGS